MKVKMVSLIYLCIFANGATAGSRCYVVGEVGGQQHRVTGRESTGLTITHTSIHYLSSSTRPSLVCPYGYVKCCTQTEGSIRYFTVSISYVLYNSRVFLLTVEVAARTQSLTAPGKRHQQYQQNHRQHEYNQIRCHTKHDDPTSTIRNRIL